MEDNKVIVLLNSIKQQVEEVENVCYLYTPICAIESILIGCKLGDYPFRRNLKEIEIYFRKNNHSVYGVGILPARKW